VVNSVAGGLFFVQPGGRTFAHANVFVDVGVTASDDAIEQAVVWLLRHVKFVVELSGVAGVAAVFATPTLDLEVSTVAVVSGGNISEFVRLA